MSDLPFGQNKLHAAGLCCMLSLVLLTGCATARAPNFAGEWRPVNAYDLSIRAIPLRAQTSFYPIPMDATLRGLLTRWAKESGRLLDYRHDQDYTLPVKISSLKADSIEVAVEKLQQIYADAAISIKIDRLSYAIVVEPMAASKVSSKKNAVAKPLHDAASASPATMPVAAATQQNF